MGSKNIAIISCIVSCIFIACTSYSHKNYYLLFNRVNCSFNSEYVFLNESFCKRKAINRTSQTVTAETRLSKNVSSLLVRVTFFYKYTVYSPTLIDITDNYCSYIQKSGPSLVFDMAKKMLLKFSNILQPSSCPIPSGFLIYLRNADLNEVDWPPFLPAGDWRLEVEFQVENGAKRKPLLLLEFYISIKERGITKLMIG